MGRTTLHHHASTVLAKCGETNEYLLGQYDPGYPGKNNYWIGRVKLLGGNYFFGKDNDSSPFETLYREIQEEFSGKKACAEEMAAFQEHNFASPEGIQLIKEILLNATPFQDYFLHHPGPEDKPQTYVIQSVFRVLVPKKAMKIIKHNLANGKSLTNEGFLAVKTLDELLSGNPLCHGITGLVIGQTEGVNLPHCLIDRFTFAPIGMPRDSYKNYIDSFQYKEYSKK